MKRMNKTLSIILTVIMIVGLLPMSNLVQCLSSFSIRASAASVPSGYIGIYTANDLYNIRNNLNKSFILMNDIDLSSYSNWTPIGGEGEYTKNFKGTLDGNNFSISNLKIFKENDTRNNKYYGLFAGASYATFKNIRLNNVEIYASSNVNNSSSADHIYCSALVGDAGDSVTFDNCHVSGTINVKSAGGASIGGLLAHALRTVTVYNSSFNGNINYSGAGVEIGGLVGWSFPNNLLESKNNTTAGNITAVVESGHSEIGGQVGYSDGTTVIEKCTNKAKIRITEKNAASSSIGGVLGEHGSWYSLTMKNCSNCGEIVCETTSKTDLIIGGIIGYSDSMKKSEIRECCNSGTMMLNSNSITPNSSAKRKIGGIAGRFWFDGNLSMDGTYVYDCFNSAEIVLRNCRSIDVYAITHCKYLYRSYFSGNFTIDNSSANIYIDKDRSSSSGVYNCYYLDTNNDIINTTPTAVSRSSSQLQNKSYLSGFDFTNTWTFDSSLDYKYPVLQKTPYYKCSGITGVLLSGKNEVALEYQSLDVIPDAQIEYTNNHLKVSSDGYYSVDIDNCSLINESPFLVALVPESTNSHIIAVHCNSFDALVNADQVEFPASNTQIEISVYSDLQDVDRFQILQKGNVIAESLDGHFSFVASEISSGGNLYVRVIDNNGKKFNKINTNIKTYDSVDDNSEKPRIYSLSINGIEGEDKYGTDNDQAMFYTRMCDNKLDGYIVEKSNQHAFGFSQTNIETIQKLISLDFQGTTDNDLSFFFFSGHGTTSGGIPVGIWLGNSYISWSALANMLCNNIKGEIVVILDCCFAECFITKGIINNQHLTNADKARFHVLAACGEYETSKPENQVKGIWFSQLIYGCFSFSIGQGFGFVNESLEADTSGDGVVSLYELYSYVAPKTVDQDMTVKVFGSNINLYQTVSNQTYPYWVVGRGFDVNADYYAEYWDSSAYNANLAEFLCAMAASVYKYEDMRSAYESLGFCDTFTPGDESTYNDYFDFYDYFSWDADPDKCGYSIGFKDSDYSDDTICLISVRGSSNVPDWIGNFKIATEDEKHIGFARPANNIYQKIQYLKERLNINGNIKYFITGHSRGAAVANLLAVQLMETGIPASNVYDYNFACPDVACKSSFSYYSNIYNLCNREDPVPFVPGNIASTFTSPGTSWGKFGNTYWFTKDTPGTINPFADHSIWLYLDFFDQKLNPEDWGYSFADLRDDISHALIGKIAKILCPVDVIVTDNGGTMIASVIDGEVSYYDGLYGDVIIMTDGDKKVIYFNGDRDFNINLVGTDEGTMTYSVEDYNVTTDEVIQEKMFTDVLLGTGKDMYSPVSEALSTDDVELFVVGENNNHEKKTYEVNTDGTETVYTFTNSTFVETDIELTSAVINDSAIVPGETLPVKLTLKNNGLTTITSVNVRSICDSITSEDNIELTLKPGQTMDLDFNYLLPLTLTGLTNIDFNVSCENDSKSENNSVSIKLGYTNLAISVEKCVSDYNTAAAISIRNNSFVPTDALIRLHKNTYDSEVVAEYSMFDIPAFSDSFYYIKQDVIENFFEPGDTVCVEVVADKEELSVGDNVQFFTVETPDVEEYSYTVLEDNKIRIDKYNGTDTNLVIPVTYDDYTVSSLAANVVPSFVNSITLPSGLETVTATTFNSATGLSEINVAENNTVFKSKEGILYSADGTKVIRCPIAITNKTIVLSDDVIEIAGYAFADVGATSVMLPESLQTIRNYAFSNNSITTLTIPESVTRIERNAFEKCSNLSTVYYNATDAETDISSSSSFLIQFLIASKSVFYNDSAIQTIEIGSNVQTLPTGLFVGLSGLQSVNIANENALASIANYTFLNDSALSDVYYGRYYKYWKQISIADGNTPITNATLHCVECDECTWDEGRITTAATCVSTGVKLFTCTVCEKERTEIVAINPNNHVGETSVINQKASTCTQEGYTGDTICADCKVVLESGTSIPKTEHTWDTGTITQPATCTETGVKTFTCSVCPETRTETIDALGHDVSTEWTIDKEPTCTESGTKSHHCSRCELKTDITDIDALGHTWNQGEVTTPATCMETGIRTYTCSVCQDTKTETIDALNHDYGDWMQFNENQHQRVCKNDASHIETENHSWNDGVVTKEASCTENGIRTYTCSACGTTKTAAINAIGHDYGDWTNLDENQHQRVCKNDSSHIEKENHSWNDGTVTKAATCTETGTKTYTCTVCGAKRTETINATGHNYGTWTLVKAPTCTEAGLEQRVCANDSNHIETRSVAKLTHDDRDGDGYCDSCHADLSSGGETQESNCVCGQNHTGPLAGLIRFFHKIVYFFKNMFGKN